MNLENRWSVEKDAGEKMDKATRYVMKRDGLKYPEALRVASKELPLLFSAYTTGVREAPKQYARESDKRMHELQADPDEVKFLAGNVMDHNALAIAGGPNSSSGIAQVSTDSYRAALVKLRQQFPNLAQAADNGFIAADDWSLLVTLIPGVSSEVWNLHKAKPLNLRSGNYSSSQSARKYDSRENEYRTYIR